MGLKLVLFNVLVLRSVFVDSFAFIKENKNALLNSKLGIRQASRNPFYAQYKKQEGFESQPYESNYYSSLAAKGYGNPISEIDNTQIKPANDRYISWGPSASLPQIQSPTLQKADTVSSAGWYGNNQRLYQTMPAHIVGQPYNANGYVKNYAKPYVNQPNYASGYPYYQSQNLPVSNSVSSPKLGYKTEWIPPQNQYQKNPNSVEYISWPVADNQKSVSIVPTAPKKYNTPQYIALDPVPESTVGDQEEKSAKPSTYSNNEDQTNPSKPPVIAQPTYKKRYIIVHANETYEYVDNLDHIVVDEFNIAHIKTKDPPNHILAIIEVEDVKGTENQTNIEGPYDTGISKIPQDNNGNNNKNPGMLQSYEYLLTQDTTENPTDDLNFFKSEYLMPIQTTTENIIDSTTYSPPQDLKTDRNTETDKDNYHNLYTLFSATDRPSWEQNFNDKNTNYVDYSTPANVKSIESNNTYTIDTTERTNEFTTINSIDTTIAAPQDTTIDKNESSQYDKISYYNSEPGSTDDENNSDLKEKSTSASAPTEDSKNDLPFDTSPNYGIVIIPNDDYNNKKLNGIYPNNDNENHFGLKENSIPYSDADTSPEKDSDSGNGAPFDNLQYGSEPTVDNDGILIQRSTPSSISYPYADAIKDSGKKKYPEDDYLKIIQEPKLRDDLKIDVSQLKTKIDDKPVVWFRRDPSFWDKVTKGENSFDALTIFDVNCKPVLIERVTTIRYFPNGTEAVDYVETLWDSLDATHPREIKAKREYRDSH